MSHWIQRIDHEHGGISYEVHGPGGWIVEVREPHSGFDGPDGEPDPGWDPKHVADCVCTMMDELQREADNNG